MQSRQTSSQPENTIVSYDSLDFVSGSAHNITVYSVKEAAEKLKISEQHLRYLLAKGEIEGRKISRDWVVLTLDYKRKRKPKRRIKTEPVVVMDAKETSKGQDLEVIVAKGSLICRVERILDNG